MKDLTIEEKAKAYDEALKNAKYYHDAMEGDVCCVLEECFPQLKESEDERIRKELIFYFQEEISQCSIQEHADKMKEFIAWLEKQVKQKGFAPKSAIEAIKEEKVDNANKIELKDYNSIDPHFCKPIDKVKQKFHEGDFIVDPYCRGKVIALTADSYLLDTGQGIPFSCEDRIHLWTIEDVKDGDVICDGQLIILFKKWEVSYDHNFVFAHAGIDINGELQIVNEHGHMISNKIKPATAEQRNLLFQKMKEVGYEWDIERKELKKIELQPHQWNISDFRTWQYIVCDVLTKHNGIGQYLDDGFCKKIAQYMQDEWSKKLCSVQYSVEWNEDDERLFQIVIDLLDRANNLGNISRTDLIACVRKLKSLNPNNHWKPSEEQMKQLYKVFNGACWNDSVIESLYNDLKKLKC